MINNIARKIDGLSCGATQEILRDMLELLTAHRTLKDPVACVCPPAAIAISTQNVDAPEAPARDPILFRQFN